MAEVRYAQVAEQLAKVCAECGRDPRSVKLVAVSKTVGPDEVAQALGQGARDFGENRPDQLVLKADRFADACWHFIGNIQSRRIRDIAGRAVLVHSLFEESHARKFSEVASQLGFVQDVLLEVNVSGEASKSGLAPVDVRDMLDCCRALPGIRVRGLMTMAPQGDPEVAREVFHGLAALHATLRAHLQEAAAARGAASAGDAAGAAAGAAAAAEAAAFDQLSMGMTDDWPQAVAEGATIIRVGRAIFPPGL